MTPRDFHILMDAFKVSEASLEANREGRLTNDQLDILRQKATEQLIGIGVTVAVGLFFLAITFPPIQHPPSRDYYLFAIVLIVFATILYTWRINYRPVQVDIRSGAAYHLSGLPYLYHSTGRRSSIYYLSVNGRVFRLSRTEYIVLENYLRSIQASRLTIYFTPATNMMLSIEIEE